ncbi:hypothetical protein FQN52_001865 [Onygenales sp. PD_12]|nr:hypothetical protein FQN52_001865 [Onygenales sp. PD_12]
MGPRDIIVAFVEALVVNDDGPPSWRSPYILPFVEALQNAGHLVSVVIPDSSRSWIGKAHIIGETVKATYVLPEVLQRSYENDSDHDQNGLGNSWQPHNAAGSDQCTITGTPDPARERGTGRHHWVVVSSTPASCTQLGLYSLFPDRAPIDLVVSGPNHGRNASTIYTLASGTVGGALEAVTCGKKAIALSFASKDPQRLETIQAASRLSVKLINHLATHWPDDVDLYNVNVPMRLDVETRPIKYTSILQNTWSQPSLYQEIDPRNDRGASQPTKLAAAAAADDDDAADQNNTSPPPTESGGQREPLQQTRYFEWAPELSDIQRSVEMSQCGTDTHAVMNGCTSVTPLIANFNRVPRFNGELKI